MARGKQLAQVVPETSEGTTDIEVGPSRTRRGGTIRPNDASPRPTEPVEPFMTPTNDNVDRQAEVVPDGHRDGEGGAHNDADLDRLLTEARAWAERKEKEAELARLLALRENYEAGRVDGLTPSGISWPQEGRSGAMGLPLGHSRPISHHLPRPTPPTTYEGKNRANYESWRRDCESYHAKNPEYFAPEPEKVNFGQDYLNHYCRDQWDLWVKEQRVNQVQFEPTWTDLKRRMLLILGTEGERHISAINRLRDIKLKPGKSPSQLMSQMKLIWDELGDPNTARQIGEFIGALPTDMQDKIRVKGLDSFHTHSQIEEYANTIWRASKHTQVDRGGKGQSRRRSNTPPSRGSNQKDPKRTKVYQKTREFKKTQIEADKDTCHNCGLKGHWARDCPTKDNKKTQSGKASGRKS
jgi:hypothetical protein